MTINSDDPVAWALRSALLWDVPELQRSKVPGAALFLRVLQLRLFPDVSADAGTEPLELAAAALSQELQGNSSDARETYRMLAVEAGSDQHATLIRLLGRGLLAWSGAMDWQDALKSTLDDARSVGDSVLAGMYVNKLGSFALEQGEIQLASAFFSAAEAALPRSRRLLRWRFRETRKRLQGSLDWEQPPDQLDPFAEFDWILGVAHSSAVEGLVHQAETLSETAWSQSLHFGLTSVDEAQAALLQAEWAGATWLIPGLRKQLAAQILVAGGRSRQEWVNGLALWILGGGGQLARVFRRVEVHFDNDSMDLLLDTHLLNGRRLNDERRYREVLLAGWDLLSSEKAAEVLQRFPPRPGDNPDAADQTQLWIQMGFLIPDEWSEAFTLLSVEQREAVISRIPGGLTDRLPVGTREQIAGQLLGMLTAADSNDYRSTSMWLGAAALTNDNQLPELLSNSLSRLIETAPALLRFQVLQLLRTPATGVDLEAPLADVIELVRSQAEQSRKGSVGFGGVSAPMVLALGATLVPEKQLANSAVRQLVDVASDPQVAAPYKLEVLQALFRLSLALDPPPPTLGELRNIRLDDFRDDFFQVTQQILNALVLGITSVASPRDSDVPSLLISSRDPDPRIREIAAMAAGERIRKQNDPSLESILYGALLDPDRDVVKSGLEAVTRLLGTSANGADVLILQLPDIYETSDREIRALTCKAALLIEPPMHKSTLRLLDEAAKDRSWLVREVQRGESSHG